MGPEALRRRIRPLRCRRQRAQRREDPGELAELVRGDAIEDPRIEGRQVGVEGVDHEPERQLLLELGAAAAQDQPPLRVGSPSELGEEERLPDPGFACHLRELGAPGTGSLESPLEQGKLGVAADELLGGFGHP
jgi:hypothetical protein